MNNIEKGDIVHKKSQSISINTIIIAAIGLAVLVVLFAIFTGRLGNFSTGLSKTDTCEQKCLSAGLKKVSDVALPAECAGTNFAGKYSDVQTNYNCCCSQS